MTLSAVDSAAVLALVVWVGLLLARGRFWRADQRLYAVTAEPSAWPGVVAVVPARNEAATVGPAVTSLLGQDYPGPFSVVLVDDGSDDGTADVARAAAGRSRRLTVLRGAPLAPGWTGKLWAVAQGLRHAEEIMPDAAFALLTDADIEHDPGTLRRLVAKAEAGRLDLVSLMALLRCEGAWERLLVPAFVFFFQKLYPFPWVNDPARGTAAAAGGCMLVRRAALDRAGGIEAIRHRLIDDVALAAALKRGGPIFLGLTHDVRSLRAYETLAPVWTMVARSAFAQLGYSVPALAATAAGMALVYLVPPLAVAAGAAGGDPLAVAAGALAWGLMLAAYRPTLALYGLSAWHGAALPVAALLFTLMTLDSARLHWQGRGGVWKGRSYGGGG